MNRWRARWSTRPLCCSGVLVGTNRMLALVTASQMASASAASFFCRLSRVEERRGDALIRAPFPLPAHQTGHAAFPHPAFRQVSSRGTRRRHFAHAVQHKHARAPVDLAREPPDATAGRIMSSAQKGQHAVEDVSINSLMSRSKRAITEVSGPAAQNAVQSRLYFGPSALVARRQQFADLPLDPQHAFLGRSRAKIPPSPIAEAAGSERVPKEVKAFQSSILHRGFSLVECQPKLGHHRLRPRQCIFRVAAAENDEVVGIGDNLAMECFTPTAETPMLQEPVHVDDGEQRTDDAALWRATLVALTAAHAPFPVAIPLPDRNSQP